MCIRDSVKLVRDVNAVDFDKEFHVLFVGNGQNAVFDFCNGRGKRAFEDIFRREGHIAFGAVARRADGKSIFAVFCEKRIDADKYAFARSLFARS
mgnify:CR=1 FL=1